MAKKMMRAGYYWLTMESGCCKFMKKCHKCQIYTDKIHVPPTLLNVISSPWPFSMWGIDMIGMIEPKHQMDIISFSWLLIISQSGLKRHRMLM